MNPGKTAGFQQAFDPAAALAAVAAHQHGGFFIQLFQCELYRRKRDIE
jgi:hypothetical protein